MNEQGNRKNMSKEEYEEYLKSQHPMFDHPFQVFDYRDGEIRVYRNDEQQPPVYQAHFCEITRSMTIIGYHPTPEAAIAALMEHL